MICLVLMSFLFIKLYIYLVFYYIILYLFCLVIITLQQNPNLKYHSVGHKKSINLDFHGVPKLCNATIHFLDNNKNSISSEVNVTQIYVLVSDISFMHNQLKTKQEMENNFDGEKDYNSLTEDENQLESKISKMCSEFKRFKIWVDIYKQLS